ncbi:heavy-metal-associated domain-containing protein [Metabacillus malikii]|uniref:Copper chaperone CopZ n=1 Tax=Metabacillus malikii TaxID=1504265 RepID=A0ABT9ZPP1_9BACI|nr:heavy-metal-associated domain-containing protein [Metabacillus malikii]MDQ0233478.1 copper chaperone CopZ [Metabacillus malikii]
MAQAVFQLEPLTCPSCIKKIETGLTKLHGVESTRVLFNSSKVKTVYDNEHISDSQLKETIQKLGYDVLSSKVAK